MHAAPIAPVKVFGFLAVESFVLVRGTIMEGSGT
jgi:hypothetical protein